MARHLFWCCAIAVCLTFPKVSLAWDVIYTPPTLTNPTTLYVPDDTSLDAWAQGAGQCAGDIHAFHLNNSQDYIIRMKPGAPAITKPLGVFGGRNVRMVGIAIDMQTQPGCGIGQQGGNIHPLTPMGKALYMQQANISYLEGAYIKMNGHESDCMIGRNTAGVLEGVAFAQRDYVIQNTRCEGWEGTPNLIHGDLFQQQGATDGGEVSRNLIFENVTGYGSYEGIVHETNSAQVTYGVKKFVARRYNYGWDPVYGDDEVGEAHDTGPPAIIAVEGAFENSLANVTLTDYWVKPFGNSPSEVYFMVSWWPGDPFFRFYDLNSGSGLDMHLGVPPGGDFAPANQVGLNYISPHDGGSLVPLTAYWKFDEGTGTNAADSSGSGFNGTLVGGPTWVDGKVGKALSFDGVDDLVTTGQALSALITATDGTVALWMKPMGTAATQTNVYDLPATIGDTGQIIALARGISSALDQIWAYNWDGSQDVVGVTYAVDEWVHIAWKHGSGTLSIYKNGVPSGSVASGTTAPTNGLATLGWPNTGFSTSRYTGLIDDVRVYNTALSDAEVRAIYDEVRDVELFPPRPFMRIR